MIQRWRWLLEECYYEFVSWANFSGWQCCKIELVLQFDAKEWDIRYSSRTIGSKVRRFVVQCLNVSILLLNEFKIVYIIQGMFLEYVTSTCYCIETDNLCYSSSWRWCSDPEIFWISIHAAVIIISYMWNVWN